MNLFRMAKTVTRSLFKGPATLMYPGKKRACGEITRGRIEIEIDQCIFCGLCGRKCPTGAINVSKEERQWSIDRLFCITCGSCVDVCPKKCLSMDSRYPPSVTARRTALFTAAAPAGPPGPDSPSE